MLFTSNDRATIEQGISPNGSDNLKTCLTIGAFHRALLDLHVFIKIPKEVIQAYIQAVNAVNILHSDNVYAVARGLVYIAAKVLIDANLHSVKSHTPDFIKERLENFYLEGSEAWVTHTALDYVSQYNKLE